MPTKKSKKKTEKPFDVGGMKAKPIVKEPVARKIKMLMSLANPQMAYTVGSTYEVGKDVSLETAKSWLNSGVAEEVKIPEVPEETK